MFIEKGIVAYCLTEMTFKNIQSSLNSATVSTLTLINVVFNNNERSVLSSTRHFHVQYLTESL